MTNAPTADYYCLCTDPPCSDRIGQGCASSSRYCRRRFAFCEFARQLQHAWLPAPGAPTNKEQTPPPTSTTPDIWRKKR